MKHSSFRTNGTHRDDGARLPSAGRWTFAAVLACAAVLAALSTGAARAAAAPDPAGPDAVARQTVLDLLAPALAVRGASATVTVVAPDIRRPLEPCRRAEGFLPPGSRLVGRTVVGVRCVDGAAWQTFVSATIRVDAPTWQTTRPLRPGEPIGSGDVVQAIAPLTAADVDAAVATARAASAPAASNAARGLAALDGREAAPIGRTAMRSVPAGRALTAADVRDEGRVNAGDPVRVVYLGNQFTVSSEGRAVGAADPGTTLVIRLPSGALVNGTLRADHVVELAR